MSSLYENYIFPRLFDAVLNHQGFESSRGAALSAVRGRILEIGVGTGLNLDFYPGWVKQIDAIEPNSGMREQLWKKAAGHRIDVRCQCASAEKLPFKAGAFDTVVSTFTLCSLRDIQKGLGEIRRVLAPGGRLVFLDHGLAEDWWTAKMQHLLNPVQNLVGCGCRLTVDVEDELGRAHFVPRRYQKKFIGTGPRILGFVYQGVAIPRSDIDSQSPADYVPA